MRTEQYSIIGFRESGDIQCVDCNDAYPITLELLVQPVELYQSNTGINIPLARYIPLAERCDDGSR